jgi:nucleoside-diphosphate-sugar epimerase
MKILVTGATGYIGSAVAEALRDRGHEVLGLARSERSVAQLRQRRIEPLHGDLTALPGLTAAVRAARVDAIISTGSVGASAGDTAATFARDRDAIAALRSALESTDQTLIFTSGSAVFGVFNRGDATKPVYAEESPLPLPMAEFASPTADVPSLLAMGFGNAMRARVQTEHLVLGSPHRGIVIRPGLVYGGGGSYDIPALIARARSWGRAGHLGRGSTTQSYVHRDDLTELYCLAIERAPRGAVLHGVTADVTQQELAIAANRMLGLDDRTESVSLQQMLGLSIGERAGLAVTERLPSRLAERLGGSVEPGASVGSGISLSLNKRLSSSRTRELVGWSPSRTDILPDISEGSYLATCPGNSGWRCV